MCEGGSDCPNCGTDESPDVTVRGRVVVVQCVECDYSVTHRNVREDDDEG